MIDTVILTIPKEHYRITNPSMFEPNGQYLLHPGFFNVAFKNNPTKKDEVDGVYKPRLTIRKRRRSRNEITADMRVEFSCPKLLFGNNVDELTENDFIHVVNMLALRIDQMGVHVKPEHVRTANVSALHVSKNIEVTNGYTVQHVLKKLSAIDLTTRFDFNRDGFRNSGGLIHGYTNSHAFVLYDKASDIAKMKGRAFDKDQGYLQASLFQELDRPPQILRYEVRLQKKPKLNKVLENLGYGKNPTFTDVFKLRLCQAILQLYWDLYIADNHDLLLPKQTPTKAFEDLMRYNAGGKLAPVLQAHALLQLRKEMGMRGLRSVIEESYDRNTWYRARNLMRDKSPPLAYTCDWFAHIESSISDYIPYKTENRTRVKPIRTTLYDLDC